MVTRFLALALFSVACMNAGSTSPGSGTKADAASGLKWNRLSEGAAFPPSYNFPVHIASDGRFIALHPEGTWTSDDGITWTKASLTWSGMNAAYLSYVQHGGGTYALGELRGNYERFEINPQVRFTDDYIEWKTKGSAVGLPKLVFYAAASFRGEIWLIGGYDGSSETNGIWRSKDGLNWVRHVKPVPWAPRLGARTVVFRDKLFVIGGGKLDGPQFRDVWSTEDGESWVKETDRIGDYNEGGRPVVFLNKLWLIGVNRSGQFSSRVLVSEDGRKWRELTAPWLPRGGAAIWVRGNSLYLTGGKYSEVRNGETVFSYYNDVWKLAPE